MSFAARKLNHGLKPQLAGKRALLIAPQPFYQDRGTPMNVRAMCQALREAGAEVDLLVYPFGVDVDGISIHRCFGLPGVRAVGIGASSRKLLLDILLAGSALRLAITRRYDVFHGIEEGAFIAGSLALLAGRPFVFDLDSNMREQILESGFVGRGLLYSLFCKTEGFFLRRAATVLTVCPSLSEFAAQFVPHPNVTQIEDFPLESVSTVDENLVAEIRAPGGPVLVYTGNLEYYQGAELMLRGFAAAGHPTARLIIVGGSTAHIETLRTLAASLGARVQFTGARPAAEMGSYLAAADLLLSPRLHGTNTPLKIYSYMASERPLLCTKIVSHTQVLTEEEAFFVEPTVESFAAGITRALQEGGVGRARAAKRLIDERYNRQSFSDRLVKLYQGLVGANESSTRTAA